MNFRLISYNAQGLNNLELILILKNYIQTVVSLHVIFI
jgi:hypothetical protein